MNDKNERRPIIDPLLMLLKSRRVLTALLGVFFSIAILINPEIKPIAEIAVAAIVALSSIVIYGLSLEDAATAGKNAGDTIPENPVDAMQIVVEKFLEEIKQQKQATPNDTGVNINKDAQP